MLARLSKSLIQTTFHRAPLSISSILSGKSLDIESKDEFSQNVLKAKENNIVIVDFHAQWCGPCKMMSPDLKKIISEHEHVDLVKIDVDECEDEIMMEHQIQAMPTLKFYKNGEEKFKKVGMMDYQQMNALISTL